MLRNYIKVAFRNLRRNKLYASLNILGLSIGLGSFFIIYLFLQNELAYDQFHEKKDRIYRVVKTTESDFGVEKEANMAYAFSPSFVESIPGVEDFSRIYSRSIQFTFVEGKENEFAEATVSVDRDFLNFFSLDFIHGSSATVFKEPNAMLISESTALKYYGTTDVLGKTVGYYTTDNYIIEGVFRNLPKSTSIKVDAVVLNERMYAYKGEGNWNVRLNGLSTYLVLKDNVEVKSVEDKLTKLYVESNKWGLGKKLILQPLSEIHYSLDVRDNVTEKTDRQYISIFAFVAVFILACSVFNYISLAISQSIERAKEIGVRKVTGASKLQLGKQFILESLLHVFISFVIAMILIELLIPQLEGLIERDLGISVLAQPILLVKGIVFSLVIAIVCSLYPTYLSTRLKVVSVFKNGKGSFSSQRRSALLAFFKFLYS